MQPQRDRPAERVEFERPLHQSVQQGRIDFVGLLDHVSGNRQGIGRHGTAHGVVQLRRNGIERACSQVGRVVRRATLQLELGQRSQSSGSFAFGPCHFSGIDLGYGWARRRTGEPVEVGKHPGGYARVRQ
jgi:hypothetical protein